MGIKLIATNELLKFVVNRLWDSIGNLPVLFFCWGGEARRGEDFIRTIEPVIRSSTGDIRSSLILRCKRAFIGGEIGWEIACSKFIRTIEWVIRRKPGDIRRTGMYIRSSLNFKCRRGFIPDGNGREKAFLDFIRTFESFIRKWQKDIKRSRYFI
ncbi:hypothetical protein A9986_09580 [Solibacillus silvestris]|nr:hypothetical protein A9986_09580 [Solibacillus silvestris]